MPLDFESICIIHRLRKFSLTANEEVPRNLLSVIGQFVDLQPQTSFNEAINIAEELSYLLNKISD